MTVSASRLTRFRIALTALGLFAVSLLPCVAGAQVADRLSRPSSLDARIELRDSVSPRVRSAQVMGHLPGETALTGMSVVIKPSAAQQAELTQLLADQQNPNSPQYHKWLTPETYGARFGLSDTDLGILQNWLTTRGFTVDSVAASRNRIVFSGTASAVESAFSTTLQRFHGNSQDYFENSTAVSLPSSLADAVSGITGISSFHLQPPTRNATVAVPLYTGGTGYHYIVPWDFRQIFGMNSLVGQGYDGTGVKIGVIGQSSVDTTQLTYFQQKIGQTIKLPTMVLVPQTGTAGQYSKSDEGESELDLEYASGTAPGATVLFIYTGLGQNNGVFDALMYAITSNQAQILTLSYGGCESQNGSYASSTLEPVLAQASSQGQTVMVSSGDTGAASCEPSSNNTTTAKGGLSVSYPASSPNVTAVGGTQLNSGTEPSTSNQYWSSTNNSSKGSAVGYMPETSWNDTVAYGALSASGGGASAIFGKPSWQTGTGVPADSRRDVPDVAFPSAVEQHAYIVCTVEATCLNNTVFGSGDTTVSNGGLIGGTSAAAPNFAAFLAVVEQATGNAAGLGNINPKLYTLAAGSTATTIFHDITTGNNIVNCTGGTTGCSSTASATTGTMGYSAGTGYDLVTGLGSIDASGLALALGSSSTATKSTAAVTLVAGTTTPVGGATDALTIILAGTGTAPTGSITLSIDGASVTTFTLSSNKTSFTYSYSVPTCTGTASCTHTVVAAYSGDTVYNAASANLTLSVAPPVTNAAITVSPATSSVTVTSGSDLTNGLTITSTGFAGTVSFTATSTLTVGCYSASPTPVTIASGGTATATFTIHTSSSACTNSTAARFGGVAANTIPPTPGSKVPLAVLAAGALGAFVLRRRRLPALMMILVATVALGMGGCGSSSTASSSAAAKAATGTYTVNVTATGTPASGTTTVSATTSFSVVVK